MYNKKSGEDIIDYDFLKFKLNPPKRPKYTDTARETAKLLKTLNSLFYVKKTYKSNNTYTKRSYEKKQPCIVKMFYSNDKQVHKNFLREYMQQNNKDEVVEKPKLFNGTYDVVPNDEILKYETNMDSLHFRFIISPDSQKIPLKNLVRSFIKQLEKATGYSFSWMAVEHHNTGKEHSHILINGIDRKTGKKIRFGKDIIKETARNIAVNICTGLIGMQTPEQVQAARDRQPFAYRYTKLDTEIESCLTKFEANKSYNQAEYESEIICRNEIMQKRLTTLVEMGLAKLFSKNVPPVYYLEKKWAEKLRSAGRYNSFIKARTELRFTPAYNLEQYTNETGKIEGVITKCIEQNDDDAWSNAIVVENRKLGKSWYIPLKYLPKEKNIVGSAISVTVEKNQHGLLRPEIRFISENRHERN